MKLPVPLLLCTAILGFSPALRAETSPVSIEVKQESKTETSKDKLTKTQRRSLKVMLVNSTKAEVAVKVKYAFFGHGNSIKEHDITMLDSGDRDATLKPSGTETVETPPTSIAYSDQHYDAKAKKMSDATGNKVVGWGVQVFAGDKMVAEAYEPLSMKDQMGKAPAVKKEEPKK